MPAAKIFYKKSISDRTRIMAWNESGGLCFYCAKPVDFIAKTFDHVIPKSKGGSGELSNVVMSCARCNVRKGNTIPSFDTIARAHSRKFPATPANRAVEKMRRPVTIASPNPKSHIVICLRTGEKLGGCVAHLGFPARSYAEKFIRDNNYRMVGT